MSEHETQSEGRQFSRRQAIKGVVGVGAVAWTVPTLQLVSMTAAHADSPSVPGTTNAPPPSTETPPVTQVVQAPPAGTTTVPQANTPGKVLGEKVGPAPKAKVVSNDPDALPHTGVSDSTFKAGIAGAAAIGLGAAIIAATRPSEDTES